MNKKRGFTFVEVMVVVIVIAIIALLAFPSYRRARIVTQNDMARAKLIEVANAARMFNEEARGTARVAGGLDGSTLVTGFESPTRLFTHTPDHAMFAQAGNEYKAYLDLDGWNVITGGGGFHFRGYRFFVCNPDSIDASGQPAGSGCDGTRIATMRGPVGGAYSDALAVETYGGFLWWVPRPGAGGSAQIVGSDFIG